ncbi:DOPA 4,5-dioxygenase family protein [Vibrio vulnificus]|uniref:DOPA 4,5-dioxygenase family protein n=1 Tax=Vibrio vulnificus TaxID=672 RepID=UPI00092A6920|nr:DOPA 4,5-dioxygenase family protein [Vibrio vulnificus]EGQ7997924.1 DOPA 4,5-dioxygenase family protein [Vibrio vulnificus]EIV8469500.1 DOPA 4,5-dioxygenase family protein [Vibrio vulnificus]EJE8694867.1 DOPA 4,5-dioxygenase family protein [Vibrio vulnificus]EJV9424786.1 DOPA 4,5-dioxygenase family protein [Vibrio vulnificus]ELE1909199.1 DOPA 4,5-dioxygenase family protein [Vibrio vulnificus]
MNSPKRPINEHDAYHAHVYFDANTLDFATSLCQRIGENFSLRVGRMYKKPVGPHTMWSCQVLFTRSDFDSFIPWLDENRGSLSVLIHADSGDELADHTKYAYWLGDEVELDLRGF